MDLVILTSLAALVGVASGVLAFFVWVRQQVDAVRQEHTDDLRKARREIHEQLRREPSAELRAEIYKELLDAYRDGKLRDQSEGVKDSGSVTDLDDSNVKRLSDLE
ncbi:MAG: hypothetical protein OXG85_03840 [Chloroflexi bacterium]|nr:hypothetical protein [Chloroflexota bacterium]